MMQKIVLFGTGNVATHLFEAFNAAKQTQVIQIYNRNLQSLEKFKSQTEVTSSLSDIKPADVYIVAIPDDSIKNFVSKIASCKTLIVHTSGSVPLLKTATRNGVFYPLQTFSKQKKVDFSQIPICIEADNQEDFKILETLGKTISQKVFPISTQQRKSLHLAAVFACNFTNHLYRIAEQICEANKLSFDILHPLIKETADKICYNSPKNVQTGPAKRKDQQTIELHLSQLHSAELKEIYTLLTHAIQKENGSEL